MKVMFSKLPKSVRYLIVEYVEKLQRNFSKKIYGVYIYNSIALGAFDEKSSDIDFVVIINEDFNEAESLILKEIHNELLNKFTKASKMEGMYIRISDVGKLNDEIEPYLYFYDGILKDYGYYDINYVTWWTLKNKGIGINSPEIQTLNFEVSWKDMIETMDYNLNQYWKGKLEQKDIFIQDEWIEFAVVTLSRIYYTLKEKDIVSKKQACDYALNKLPQQFRKIINEGLRIRETTNRTSLYEEKIHREKEVKEFVGYVMEKCNKILEK